MQAGDDVNIATDNSITMKYLIAKIHTMAYKGTIKKCPERGSDVIRHTGCNKKIMDFLNFKSTDFDEALSITISWYSAEIAKSVRTYDS